MGRTVASRRLLSLASTARRRPSTALLNVKDAAARLGKSVSWLYHSYAAEGLHSRRVGSSLRFREDGIEAYVAGRPEGRISAGDVPGVRAPFPD
jgi:predicted DNA-binding transcriptional regulator AlpA